ncbi:hypothetical protein D6783_00015, partial [Candidatus Woesearchaeota archaeon]
MNTPMNVFLFKRIARSIPGLSIKLQQAKIEDTPEEYVKKTFMTAVFLALALCFIAFGLVSQAATNPFVVFLFFPIFFLMGFFYFIKYA